MVIMILEALLALALLIFIVWWTMFAGRTRGERRVDAAEAHAPSGDEGPRRPQE